MFSFIRVALFMVSLHSNKILSKIKVVIMDWGIAMIGLNMLLFRGMWTLGVGLKWGLMGYTSRNMEDSVLRMI